MDTNLSEIALSKIVAEDEEETALAVQASQISQETAWEYGVQLPDAPPELTPEQLDSAEALYMRDIRRYNLLTAHSAQTLTSGVPFGHQSVRDRAQQDRRGG